MANGNQAMPIGVYTMDVSRTPLSMAGPCALRSTG